MVYLNRQDGILCTSGYGCTLDKIYGESWYKAIGLLWEATILYGFSTLRGYWVYVEINIILWSMNKTLKWSYISYELGHYW